MTYRTALLAVLQLSLAIHAQANEDSFRQPPQHVLTQATEPYLPQSRSFQGIPSLARTENGRLWATWYASATGGEDANNYVVVVTSADDGATWTDASLIIDPDGDGPVRAFDPELWIDPTGKLWVFWAQAFGHNGSVAGVWAVTTDNPDADTPQWSPPRRLTDGIMMCKPLVLSTGEWVLPASTWRETDNSARMVVSSDHGKTWSLRGAANIPQRMRVFDEHMIIERNDGSLWMLIRSNTGFLLESHSADRGATWTEAANSTIPHPSSRFFIRRLQSGNLLLVKHHKTKGRDHLTALLSTDDGQTWNEGLELDPRGTVSYPDGIQTDDGKIYIIYDRNRDREGEILMAVFDEDDILRSTPDDSTRLRVPISRFPLDR